MMINIKIQLGRELMWLALAQVPHPNAYLNPRMYLKYSSAASHHFID